MNTVIAYGSSMGNTQSAAEQIQTLLGGKLVDVAQASAADLAEADLLVLGTSTWGDGDLQDDWVDFLDELKSMDLNGKKVAIFGMGDQENYGETYVDGMGEIYQAAFACGADIIGQTSTDGYNFAESKAVVDGQFVGLALDEDNQSDQTQPRIEQWVKVLSSAVGAQ